jgi:hypothetical protein
MFTSPFSGQSSFLILSLLLSSLVMSVFCCCLCFLHPVVLLVFVVIRHTHLFRLSRTFAYLPYFSSWPKCFTLARLVACALLFCASLCFRRTNLGALPLPPSVPSRLRLTVSGMCVAWTVGRLCHVAVLIANCSQQMQHLDRYRCDSCPVPQCRGLGHSIRATTASYHASH